MTNSDGPVYAFCGDRDVAVEVLSYLIDRGELPSLLVVSDPSRASHASALRELCAHLSDDEVLIGETAFVADGLDRLRSLNPRMVLAVHFPYLVPPRALEIPTLGWINLHPAYLPFNRGWHTPSWAMLERTPAGATLHLMEERLDSGDIISQVEVPVEPQDTADALYSKIKTAEVALFQQTWPQLVEGTFTLSPQDPEAGTSHLRQDLLSPDVQKVDLTTPAVAETLLQLRALTTNDIREAAYFEIDGKRYRIRVSIIEDSS